MQGKDAFVGRQSEKGSDIDFWHVSFTDPKFACIVKGIFLCLECAGVHRSFSTDVSRIKSVDTDVWTDEMLQVILSVYGASKKKFPQFTAC